MYEKILEKLKSHKYLIERNYNDIEDSLKNFEEDIKHLENTERNLTIAIVGQVKAGKSSFLNAALFDGQTVLPKAATPMTAALTIIRYSEEVKAEIEFYSKEDWDTILKADNEYKRIYKETKKLLMKEKEEGFLGKKSKEITKHQVLMIADIPEECKSAHELVEMTSDRNINYEKYLGKTEVIKGVSNAKDLMGKIENYVGADGKFTPIVKSSIIYYNSKPIEGMEIIDTPGINDPVISRGRVTKKHLGRCDVVFMLSRCGNFMDIADLQILAQNLPESGVKHIKLIGSQLDNEMLGEYTKYDNITQLLDNLEYTLEQHAENTFNSIKKKCNNESEQKILDRLIDELPPTFISAMAFNINKHFGNLDKEEQHFLNLYNNMYEDFKFNPETLLDLSNIEPVRKILLEKKQEKEEILKNRLNERQQALNVAIQNKIEDLKNYVHKTITSLKEEDIKSLKDKQKTIVSKLNKGREQIEGCFEKLINNIRTEFSMLKTEIKDMSRQFRTIQDFADKKHETYVEKIPKRFLKLNVSWLFGYNEVTKTRTISYRYANIHDAIDKVEDFVVKVERKIKEKIVSIIDLPKFKNEIRNGAMSLFDVSDENFDVDDIINPVERVVAKITVPDIDIDKDYSSKISKEFSGYQVIDSQIESLNTLQRKTISSIIEDIKIVFTKKISKITDSLEKNQKMFINELIKDITVDLEKIRKGLQHKEQTIKKYEKLALVVDEI